MGSKNSDCSYNYAFFEIRKESLDQDLDLNFKDDFIYVGKGILGLRGMQRVFSTESILLNTLKILSKERVKGTLSSLRVYFLFKRIFFTLKYSLKKSI